MVHPIYLDYNGTTPIDPEVADAMRQYMEIEFGNPSSSHWYGINPKRAVEKARAQVAALLNCAPEEIIFTSGGTESNNHAIKGVAWKGRNGGGHIITSQVEHPAVLEVCRFLEKWEVETTFLPVDAHGRVDPDAVERAIRPDTGLITIMHANNEVGTIQPIADISRIARRRNIRFHTDAAQTVGKLPTDTAVLGVDLLSVAGHKVYAPKGVGALYVKKGISLENFCHGAGQERGFRGGTENVMQIVGLGKACEIAKRDFDATHDRISELTRLLYAGITSAIEDVRLNGPVDRRLPNTLSLSFKGLEANRILEEIGLEVAASAGAACHADTVEISHVLTAMGVPEAWAKGTLRFSTGRMTTHAEIEKAIPVIVNAVRKLEGRPH